MISPGNIWISFILPQCPLLLYSILLSSTLQSKCGLKTHTQIICRTWCYSMWPYVAEVKQGLDRRETGTNIFPAVQTYQCHTSSEILHVRGCLCQLRVVNRDSAHYWASDLQETLLSSQSLRSCWCHQVLQNSVYFPLSPNLSYPCPGSCAVSWWLTLFIDWDEIFQITSIV